LVIKARFICMFYAHFLCGFISSTWVNTQVIQFYFCWFEFKSNLETWSYLPSTLVAVFA